MKCRAVFSAWLLLCAFAPAKGQATTAENFDDLARRAEAVLDTDPAQAADLYRKTLELRPSWPEGWFYLGGALFRTSKYAEARDSFRKGLDLSPNNGTAWGFLGLCEYELNHFEEALTDIGKGEQIGLGANHEFETAVRQGAAV